MEDDIASKKIEGKIAANTHALKKIIKLFRVVLIKVNFIHRAY